MKKIRKFFDKDGKEVEPKDASSCHELEVDDKGVVTKDTWYFAEEKKD